MTRLPLKGTSKNKRSTSSGFSHHVILPVLAVLAVGAIGFYLTLMGRAATIDTSGSTFKLFSPEGTNVGGTANEGNVQYFKYIIGDKKAGEIPGISSDAKVIRYSAGPYANLVQTPCELIPNTEANSEWIAATNFASRCGRAVLEDSAFARGLSSNLGVYTRSASTVLLTPNDPNTLSFSMNQATRLADGYDGLLADDMGVAPLRAGYVSETSRVPGTTRAYTSTEWMSALTELMQAKREGLDSSKQLLFNGLANGDNYFKEDSAARLIDDNVSGAMAERMFREPGATTTDWRSQAAWEKDLEMMKSVESKGKNGFWWTKCWSVEDSCTKEGTGSGARTVQVRQFAVASFLLGAGTNSYFNFDQDKNDNNGAEFYSADYTRAYAVKAATAEYQKQSTNLFTRSFSKGVVIVNPTDADITYNLGSVKYLDFGDKTATGAYKIPAHTGHVLERVDDTTPPPPDDDSPADSTKTPIVGYVDKDGVPAVSYRTHKGKALINNYTVNVYWSEIEKSRGSFDVSSIQSQIAAAESVGGQVRLRIFAGRFTPGWVKEQVGTVRWVEPHDDDEVDPYQLPKFWTTAYQNHYTKFVRELSNRYDSNPRVAEVTASMCMTTWAEPFVRQSAVTENRTRAIAAGYTYAADFTCLRKSLNLFDTRSGIATAGKLFPNTRVTLAGNPFQGFNPPKGSNSADETIKILRYCRTILGPRCVQGNNSVRSTSQGAAYEKMYSYQKTAGKPLYYQLATDVRVGDYKVAITKSINQGSYSVEFSKEDYPSYSKDTLANLLSRFPRP